MTIRPTQSSTFALIRQGLLFNFSKLVDAQEQVSSGKRILRPSDDPIGSSQALAFRRRIAGDDRFKVAARDGQTLLDTAATGLQDAAGLVSDARQLVLQGMNGTLSPSDRQVLAHQIRLVRDQLLSIANGKSGDNYLFGGTKTDGAPYVANGARVDYAGNDDEQSVLVGFEEQVGVGIPGNRIFSKQDPTGTHFSGETGAASGTSADQGSGYDFLEVRHTSTSGTIGLGVQLVNGGASDTIMSAHTLVIDGANGTLKLDNGAAIAMPSPSDPAAADFTVTNDLGETVHLDLSGYTGGSTTATLTGNGSVSIDGSNYVAINFTETDLELVDSQTGSVLHVDTTQIHGAGRDLVTFGGTVNVFDVLQGVADDLDNAQGLDDHAQLARLNTWLVELDHDQQSILQATSQLGARSRRLADVESRLDEASTQVKGLLSNVEDADFSQVVLDMSRAEQTLQLAQSTSVRLMQNSLLNFLK
jgi:flagellar hook-associated protein 3 FlgL